MAERWDLSDLKPATREWVKGDGTCSPMGPHELERFKARVAVVGGCWQWTGAMNENGYGVHKRGPRHSPRPLVHRLILAHLGRPPNAGEHIDHICQNRGCVNPAHLEAVTPAENFLRSNHKKAKAWRDDTCPRGHPLPPPNEKGRRNCNVCAAERKRKKMEDPTYAGRVRAKQAERNKAAAIRKKCFEACRSVNPSDPHKVAGEIEEAFELLKLTLEAHRPIRDELLMAVDHRIGALLARITETETSNG